MSLAEWFDTQNIEHLKAFKQLQRTGFWPPAFYREMRLSVDEEIGKLWAVEIASKLANAYIKEKLP